MLFLMPCQGRPTRSCRTPALGLALLCVAAILAVLAPPVAAQEVRSTGTGFFVNAGGWLVSNAHVVDDCSAVDVVGHGRADSIVVDTSRDLAVMRVRSTAPTPPLPFRSTRARLAETVTALGYPLAGLLSTDIRVTTGSVSSFGGIAGGHSRMQISAPIQPGNSGGPLIDADGAVLGAIVATLSQQAFDGAQNVNFAIPGEVVMEFLEEYGIAFETVSPGAGDRPLPDVVERAVRSTVLLGCLGASAPGTSQQGARPPRPSSGMSQGMARIEGHDIPAFDYRTLRNVAAGTCEQACLADGRCQAYTYNRRHRVCFLKEGALVLVRNADATSAVVPELTEDLLISGFTVRANIDAPGGDYARRRGADFIGCFVTCLTDDRCRAFAYVRGTRDCWLKDRVGQLRAAPGVELGLR